MHYWNQDNFEGLLKLAGELEKTQELRPLAEYCVLREKGLRRKALEQLDGFLDEAARWDAEMARRNVLIVLEAAAHTPETHQFMTHPLLMGLVCPTLEQWTCDEPSAVEPLRWLGLLRSDADALKRALFMKPSDIQVRRRLINIALGAAEYATHHLGESILLGTVQETRASIASARRWIESAPDDGA